MNDQFLTWLRNNQAYLAGLVSILQKFLEQNPTVPAGSGTGPVEYRVGGVQPITVVPLSPGDIDKLNVAMGEAVVVEKAVEFVKGVVAGIVLVTGGAA